MQQVATQPADDAVGRGQRGKVAHRVQQGPHYQGQSDENEFAGHLAQWRVMEERAVDHPREGDCLHHDHRGAARGKEERHRGDSSQPGHPCRQGRVDQTGPTWPRGRGVHSRNVVSFTLTARPTRPSATARWAVSASSQVAALRTPSARSATMAVRTGSKPSTPPYVTV